MFASLLGLFLSLSTSSSFAQSRGDGSGVLTFEEEQAQNRLANQIGWEKASKLVERFGESAEDSLDIENAIKLIAARRVGEVDHGYLNVVIDRVANRGLGNLSIRQRKQLSRSWMLIYDVTKRLDGDTPDSLEQLRIAYDLDPEDESLARELSFQQKRADIVQARLTAARDAREGYEPDYELPELNFGGGGGENNGSPNKDSFFFLRCCGPACRRRASGSARRRSAYARCRYRDRIHLDLKRSACINRDRLIIRLTRIL